MTAEHSPGPGTSLVQLGRQDATFTVSTGRVDLWLMRSPDATDGDALDTSELDAAERHRAASFIRPADGLLYATAHVALRRLLSRYTDTTPQDLRFFREPCPGCGGAHGRPAVTPTPGRPPLHFSLSHSGGVALVGVAAVPVGVDVERLPRRESVEICGKALHPDEQSELADAEAAELTARFGRIWTRKEAFLKGIGTGLSRSPAQDYLGVDARRHPPGWTVLDIPCTTTHAAAAAVWGETARSVDVRWLTGDWLRAQGTGGRADVTEPALPALAC
ncbi:4'-phosphopantetheinyl transferase superfamily protein [Streptomyces sp. NBC_00237]|uniref:4'-phosphopantetheinyl transferase family protein n=1 Tax=Streptomyces sp. NBC_00237 TaxID=2975687 RepID=UPI00224D5F48|nr:4'-phosphopantetheinyl transferase superfamily protein [Streptomyces sp. NBC_00237]MCX5203237.1 4'-phosphopantetheinyl transferase superfamily protein [Streptomyces sp. NBC_00237]